MAEKNYCFHCMHELQDVTLIKCPFCGDDVYPKTPTHQLRPGTVLVGEYLVGRALGQGGFGITYIGRDLKLDRVVAIKEFFPAGYSNRNNEVTNTITITQNGNGTYDAMKRRFLDEARVLAKFGGIPGVVNVMRFFSANNTAYFVMEYLRGTDLKHYVNENGPMTGQQLFPLLRPAIQALEKIHAEDVIHRDISPDNLMLQSDGTLKLLDFGAAREFQGDKSLSVELKHGYAPPEQYSGGGQGPWTDVYALCATIYYCLTGVKPQASVQRAMDGDELKKPSELGAKLETWQEAAILRGLNVRKDKRYQSMQELEDALYTPIKNDNNIDIITDTQKEEERHRREEERKRREEEERKHRQEEERKRSEKEERKKLEQEERKKRGKETNKKLLKILVPVMAVVILLVVAGTFLFNRKVQIAGKEYARDTTYMDLKDAELDENALASLARLTKLTTVKFTNCSIPYNAEIQLPQGLNSLSVVGCDNFRLPEQLPELTELELDDIVSVRGMDAISGYAKLNKLTIRNCDGVQPYLDSFSELSQLNTLYLEKLMNISDFSPIGNMTQLQRLSLSGNTLQTTDFLYLLTSLKEIKLSGCGLVDGDYNLFSVMPNLRTVDISENDFTELVGFLGTLNLSELDASHNRIIDLSGLDNCTRLQTVDLSGNMIEEASVLSKSAAYLKNLNLADNRLSDVSFLEGAEELHHLNLDGNNLYSVDLSTLYNLKVLTMRACKLSSLTLPDTTTIQSLDLYWNDLNTISFPEKLPNLNYLDVSYNNFTTFTVPDTDKRLTLIASANPLVVLDFVDEQESFNYLILDNCPDVLLQWESEASLTERIGNLTISNLAFRYPRGGIDKQRLKSWNPYQCHVSEAPLDRVVDLQEIFGTNYVHFYDSLWPYTESIRPNPVGLDVPPTDIDYADVEMPEELIKAVQQAEDTLSANTLWSNITDVVVGKGYTIGLRADGTVAFSGKSENANLAAHLQNWIDVDHFETGLYNQYLIGYRKSGGLYLEPLMTVSNQWQANLFPAWTYKQILLGYSFCAALSDEGRVYIVAENDDTYDAVSQAQKWKDIIQIASDGYQLIVGLKSDGSIVCNDEQALSESGAYWGSTWGDRRNWTNIRELISSPYGIYGIREDGTVLGMNRPGWDNIQSLYFGSDSMFGLRSDGTVATNFSEYAEEDERLIEVAGWKNIVQLSFGATQYVPLGLRSNGTVCNVAGDGWTGRKYAEWDCSDWTGVSKLYSGMDYTIGLRTDGTLLVTGGEYATFSDIDELKTWTDIIEIFTGDDFDGTDHIVGLKSDGTLVAAGLNDFGQCDVA